MDESLANSGCTAADAYSTVAEAKGAGGCKDAPAFEVLRVCPCRRKSAVKANAYVRFGGQVDIQIKVVLGPKGLFIAEPTGQYRDPTTGRTRYLRRVRFLDRELRADVESAVVAAYAARLAEIGRHPPKPRPGANGGRRRNRVKELLEEASEHFTPEKAREVMDRLHELLQRDDLTPGELRSLGTAFVKMHIGELNRLTAALDATLRLYFAP